MDNKEKEISSLKTDTDKFPNDYNFLWQKLKTIKKIINLLEKNFSDKEL